jgi:predicted phage terminase large subunit-like protein
VNSLNSLKASYDLRQVNRELARRQLLRFTQWTKPDYLIGRPHRLLSRYCDMLVEGRINRLAVFMPPRHGKSELVSRRLPAQFLGRFPDQNVIATSYAADLANRMNRDCQRIIDSPQYRELFPGTRLATVGGRGQAAIRTDELFEVKGRAGSYRSAGVGGGITGMGFDLGIIDDPFKNFEESHSRTIRDKVDEWYSSTFWTRQAPGARLLLTMTRWHADDLAGRLLKRSAEDREADQWVILRMPGIASGRLHRDDDRRPGEALWPERFPVEFHTKARAALGGYLYAGMYEQDPQIEGGNHFKLDWFNHRYVDLGHSWQVGGSTFAKCDCTVFITCDPAASEKQTADNTAIGVFAVTPQQDMLVLEIAAGRYGVDGIVPELVKVFGRWQDAGWIACEATGFQVSVVNQARRTAGLPPIRELSHEGKGKLVRATPAIILAESGKLWLPAAPMPWVQPYLAELTAFTGLDDDHDDRVDVTAYAVWQMPRLVVDTSEDQDFQHSNTRPAYDSAAGSSGLWGRRV